MTTSNLLRWAGLAALAGGTLIIVAALVGLAIDPDVSSGVFIFEQVLNLLGTPLVLLGLVGLYTSEAPAAGPLGLLGFLAAFVGTTLLEGIFWGNTFLAPTIAAKAPKIFQESPPLGPPLTFLSVSIGWLLFGVGTLRAGHYPRVGAILVIVGGGLSLLRIFETEVGVAGAIAQVGFFVLAVIIAWLGLLLFLGGGRVRRFRRT
jgi:hypothetical protein